MSRIPSPRKLKPKIINAIPAAGNIVSHQISGINAAPSEIICPNAGVGGCSPRPTKLKDAPIRITQPTSSAIFVKIGDKQLGRISLKRMCALEAPINSAFLTKYSSEIDDAWLYTSRVYHGHHIIVTASYLQFPRRIRSPATCARSGATAANATAPGKSRPPWKGGASPRPGGSARKVAHFGSWPSMER